MKVALLCLISLVFLTANSKEFYGDLYETRPEKLKKLEDSGYLFSRLFCDQDNNQNKSLYDGCQSYKKLVDLLNTRVGLRVQSLSQETHSATIQRLPVHWLKSPNTRFNLIGWVLRPDKVESKCGQARFAYRLVGKYIEDQKEFETYAPMTLMVVKDLKGDCQDLYNDISSVDLSGEKIRFEVNLLAARVDSPYKADSAGYAEYLMRVFEIEDGKLSEITLENTLDLEKIESNGWKDQVKSWIAESSNLKKIDQGTHKLPQKYLAKEAISISPFGSKRLSNAPYSQIFSVDDFSDVSFDNLDVIQNPELLLRRLNSSTCMGCHQIQSSAGFHFLGGQLEKSSVFNRGFLPASPHFFTIQKFREKNDSRLPQPLTGRTGTTREICSESLKCQPGLECKYPAKNIRTELQTGFCEKSQSHLIGMSCISGEWKNQKFASALQDQETNECFNRASCLPQLIGFPSGYCTDVCNPDDPNTTCHRVPALQNFTDCQTAGHSLAKCFETATIEKSFKKCSVDTGCRPDYVCAASTSSDSSIGQKGACSPPYFLLQLNVRGHRF